MNLFNCETSPSTVTLNDTAPTHNPQRKAPHPVSRKLSLSKSSYLKGLQCTKLLWTYLHRRELIPAANAAQQHIFDTGHLVGDLAKELYPGGIEVPMDFDDLATTASETSRLLARPWPDQTPIFEASFLVDQRYCRVDVLVPVQEETELRWDLIEVKSSARVKDVNVQDVAFQCDTLQRAGVSLRNLYLMHVDTTYTCGDDFDVQKFFHLEDIGERVQHVLQYVPQTVDRLSQAVAGGDPDIPLGPHCTKPYTCSLIDHCWSELPDDNVTDLTYGRALGFDLLNRGIFRLADAPTSELSPRQRIQQQAVISGQPHRDPVALRTWLDSLSYPLHHLDFETMNPAVPPFSGVRPFQQVPFQFSLHIQATPGAAPQHVEFIATEPSDPRGALLQALHAIGETGTILAWNMSFEKGVLNNLAEVFPDEAEWLAGLNDRLVDLMVPFRSFAYYHPAQKGSCSLKAVLPALTGLDYQHLEIADGNHAAHAYAEAVHGTPAPAAKEKTLSQLLAYCELDTLAMVKILDVISAAAS